MPPLEDILLTTAAQLDTLPGLTEPLLDWYRENARRLPWREDPNLPDDAPLPPNQPYRVWISEIMCQQTRVEAVKGYFDRFLQALPTVADLAAVDEAALLKLWEGLGYYSRARNLQKAARVVMERHGGSLPASYDGLLALPGIGEYTAGAIASIAFGIPIPAVDGNVYRVLSRILASFADTSRPAVKRAFRSAAARLLPDHHPGNRSPAGNLNQALMELGATVCLPNAPPLCDRCPVADACAAREQGCALELPVKAEKKPRRVEERTVTLVLSNRGVLLFRRGETGLLAGLHEPLNREGRLDRAQALEAVRALGGQPVEVLPLAGAKHIFSHVEWRMDGWLVYTPVFAAAGGVWASLDDLRDSHAVPSAYRAFFRDIAAYLERAEEIL